MIHNPYDDYYDYTANLAETLQNIVNDVSILSNRNPLLTETIAELCNTFIALEIKTDKYEYLESKVGDALFYFIDMEMPPNLFDQNEMAEDTRKLFNAFQRFMKYSKSSEELQDNLRSQVYGYNILRFLDHLNFIMLRYTRNISIEKNSKITNFIINSFNYLFPSI